MEIISLQFAGFVLIIVSIYHLLPPGNKKWWLLASSVFFYLLIDIRYVLVLTILVLINYWLGNRILQSKRPGVYSNLTFILNLSAFGLLKILSSRYTPQIFGGEGDFQSTWLLPVGFSFYLLQLISFQLELRNGRISKLPPLLDFSLYFVYFPKLLSGPIEKPRIFLERLSSPGLVNNAAISRGFGLIFIGVLRKLLIANLLTLYMPNWIGDINKVGWSHVIGYVILLYNDFAGYTSVVRGVSCLFGIELSANFQQPFLARNFSEFWNRWHITLSTWLRETIYFPVSRNLSRNSGSFLPVVLAYLVPPLVTMLASGFWHGASLAMLLWGGLQGILLILERAIYERWPGLRPQSLTIMGKSISGIIVFLLFSLSMVPFAVNSVKPTLGIWSGLFSRSGYVMNQSVIPVLVLGGFSFFLDFLSQKAGKDIWWEDMKMIPRSAIIAIGIIILAVALVMNTTTSGNVFIYQGF